MAYRGRPEDKIIEALCRLRECNLNTLRREIGLSYYTLIRALNSLVSRGIVVEKRVGRLRVFRITENQLSACRGMHPSGSYTSSRKTSLNTSQ